MKRLSVIVLLCALFFPVFSISPVSAHSFDYGAIRTLLAINGKEITLHSDVPQQIGADAADDASKKQLMQQYFNQNLTIRNQNQACSFVLNSFSSPSDKQTIYDGVYNCPNSVSALSELQIHSTIFADFFTSFDHFVTITKGAETVSTVFKADVTDFPAGSTNTQKPTPDNKPQPSPATQTTSKPSLTGQFIKMGIEHIWTGYDHILFLLSAILLLRSIKKILVVVTSFTLAHSVTLILAGLGIVTITPRLVEPLIALTIIFVSLQNIQILKQNGEKSKRLSERWMLTGAFGLVHGLGFAGALLETGIPKDYFVPSLIFFNIGVEIGQLSILAFLVPLLLFIDTFASRKKILLGVSSITVLLASFWFLQRIF